MVDLLEWNWTDCLYAGILNTTLFSSASGTFKFMCIIPVFWSNHKGSNENTLINRPGNDCLRTSTYGKGVSFNCTYLALKVISKLKPITWNLWINDR